MILGRYDIGRKQIKYILLALIALGLLVWFFSQPSNGRDWATDQKILSYSEFDGDSITVYNIRNFSYSSTTDYKIQYYNKTFDLEKLDSVYYIVEPFSDWDGAAHTFFSFGFEDGEYVAISVEIRKEKGEKFSALKGLFRQYEIMYVVGDENDLVKLRSNYRKDEVFLYPANTTRENMRTLFVNMLEDTNRLKEKPEFYNTLTTTCTTEIVRHANAISPNRIPFSFKILAPGYSDELAYDLGLIERRGNFEETREYFKINDRAFGDGDFSEMIRR